jgi:hypothetical protein
MRRPIGLRWVGLRYAAHDATCGDTTFAQVSSCAGFRRTKTRQGGTTREPVPGLVGCDRVLADDGVGDEFVAPTGALDLVPVAGVGEFAEGSEGGVLAQASALEVPVALRGGLGAGEDHSE